MKSIIFFAAVLALAQGQEMFLFRHGPPSAGPPDARAAIPTWGNITQRQDNFDASNQNTWTMRYAENGQYFRAGGPIFLFLNGEWTADPGWLQNGNMYQMAQIHSAYMYGTEHRYYGQSQPTADMSTKNLKYLSTRQALEDVAQFIIKMKQNNPTLANSKVVVFGLSYAGNLAIWMRQQYPHLVHAALSSSAPVLAKVDFSEAYNVVLRNMGVRCAAVVTRGVEEIQRLLSVGNAAKVEKDLNKCRPIITTDRYNVESLFNGMAINLFLKFQFGDLSTVPTLCKALQNPTSLTDYERLTAYFKGPPCKQNYKPLLENMTSTYDNNGRAWHYQVCTEYGYYPTSWSTTALFGRTISAGLTQRSCSTTFDPAFTLEFTTSAVAATNVRYGGLQPNVTHVISLHGALDPWSGLGLKKDEFSEEAPVIYVEGASHTMGMSNLHDNDPDNVRNAVLAIRRNIATWLQEP